METNPLSVASLANIFSHYESCLFVLFTVSFAVQKLLSFIRSHLFIFVFISISLRGESKRIQLWFMSYSVLPMFSSKSFIVSGLTFRSLNVFKVYFELIFVHGVRECSNVIILHVAVQFSRKKVVFSPLYILASFIKNKVTISVWVYLWAFYPVPLIYISVFVPVQYYLYYYSFAV